MNRAAIAINGTPTMIRPVHTPPSQRPIRMRAISPMSASTIATALSSHRVSSSVASALLTFPIRRTLAPGNVPRNTQDPETWVGITPPIRTVLREAPRALAGKRAHRAEPVGDRQAAVPAEGLVGDADAGRGLAALVLGSVDEPHHLHHRFLGEAICDEVLDPHVALHVGLENAVEQLVGRQGV